MATNAHSGKLDRLLAYHEDAAKAIRFTMGLLNGQAKAAKTNGHATVLAQAVALDSERAAKAPKHKKSKRPMTRAAIMKQRERSAQVLAAFTKAPRPASEVAQELGLPLAKLGFAPLINHGYLKKTRGGYVRTAKAYVVERFGSNAG